MHSKIANLFFAWCFFACAFVRAGTRFLFSFWAGALFLHAVKLPAAAVAGSEKDTGDD